MSGWPGSAVWLSLGLALGAWLVVTSAFHRKLPTVVDMMHWWLGSWAGRLVMLGLWVEAGVHVFTQHP